MYHLSSSTKLLKRPNNRRDYTIPERNYPRKISKHHVKIL
jgi:hypothetical protein